MTEQKILNGDIFNTNSSGKFRIIKNTKWNDIEIEFLETGYRTITTKQYVLSGVIKDKMCPSVKGVGFIGEGEFKVEVHGQRDGSYTVWVNMISRCYCKKQQAKQPTYAGCTVCKEWHNYQNFAQWFKDNHKEGMVMDKDILIEGNKIYSPEFCTFVSPQENTQKAHAKEYIFLSPKGEVNTIYNLSAFCRENNLEQSSMCQVNKGRFKQHKGWALYHA